MHRYNHRQLEVLLPQQKPLAMAYLTSFLIIISSLVSWIVFFFLNMM